MAPAHSGALIAVFTQRHRAESKVSDFPDLHFGGDRPAFGLHMRADQWRSDGWLATQLIAPCQHLWLDGDEQVPLHGSGIPAVNACLAAEVATDHRFPVRHRDGGHGQPTRTYRIQPAPRRRGP
jgi:hypothetical protein